ncbi:cobalt transporter CbiM [Thermoflexus sp.]|jgi:cobalt/nickel transport system permease protein|uniref:cobalt transporter CbiM n=1 Tax=Thermoflexus sp. TaxID=1969742 RepID=UPI003C04E00A
MHIPDGYLSPETCAVLAAGSAPALYVAARRLRQDSDGAILARLALASAFGFVVQMLNVPVPDGTSAHAVGAALAAILLGPWGAMLAMTVTLVIQALFFGDGGILALGANIFNLGILAPAVAYVVYQTVAGRSPSRTRLLMAAALAGYLSINAAALATAIELGLQPLLFRAPDGTPLYNPYPLNLAVPAMMFAHLVVAGPVEALVTGLIVGYVHRVQPDLLARPAEGKWAAGAWLPLVVVLGLLIVLTPLGLLAPGTAFGEWAPEELGELVGYVPRGLAALSGQWSGLLPDYAVPILEGVPGGEVLGYLLSALMGVLLTALVWGILRWLLLRPRTRS